MLLVARLMPAEPDLADALSGSPRRDRAHATAVDSAADRQGTDRAVGHARPAAGLWVRTPTRELALLRIPLAQFYGDKLVFAVLGLLIPPLLVLLLQRLSGWASRSQIPAFASLGLAAVMFFMPNYNAIDDARKARLEFARALGAYIDLVALERNNGIGVRQAMEAAAEVGDSWVFTRLSEELTRSRWSGLPPWDALHTLAEELGLPELDDFADIMRLSGEEGASVYATLRARSAAMRTAMLNDEIAQANAVGERMTIPGSLLGVIFMALLVAPSLLRMFTTLVTTEGHIHRRKPMLKVLVLLQTRSAQHVRRPARMPAASERGSVTTEHVLWAVAVIAHRRDRRRRGDDLCHTQAGNIK